MAANCSDCHFCAESKWSDWSHRIVFDTPVNAVFDARCSTSIASNSAKACTRSSKFPLLPELQDNLLWSLNACFWSTSYRTTTISLFRIVQFLSTCWLCLVTLIAAAWSNAFFILTHPKTLSLSSDVIWPRDFEHLFMACERFARSTNPVVRHGLFKELLDRSNKNQGQQKSQFSFMLLISHSTLVFPYLSAESDQAFGWAYRSVWFSVEAHILQETRGPHLLPFCLHVNCPRHYV